MKIILRGQIPSGKNQQQIAFVRGRLVKFPNRRFKAWREAALLQFLPQARGIYTLVRPCVLRVAYWPGDRIRRDVSGMLDALFHLLERGRLVENDCLIEHVVWRRMALDRTAPRVEMELEEVTDGAVIGCPSTACPAPSPPARPTNAP